MDALYVGRYWRYVRQFVQPSVDDRFIGEPLGSLESEVLRYRENPMFDLLGVRAIVSDHELDEATGPASPGNVGLRLLGRRGGSLVYENVNAYPRAWVVHTVHAVRTEDDAFRYLRRHTLTGADGIIVDHFDPLHEAVVETGASSDTTLDSLRPGRADCAGDTDRAEITKYRLNSVRLRVRAECAGLLVLPDTYFPGWSVTVDGRSTRLYATNGAFRGVRIPRGVSIVTFDYDPARFEIGLGLAGFGLAGFGGIAWRRQRRRRRGERADEPAGVRGATPA
jgi:hypothetical protein